MIDDHGYDGNHINVKDSIITVSSVWNTRETCDIKGIIEITDKVIGVRQSFL